MCRWLDAGHPAEWLRGVIRLRLARGGVRANPAFSYFDGAVTDAISKPPVAPVVSAPPAPVLSAEDKALAAKLKPSGDAWTADRTCPFPPTRAAFRTAEGAGHGPLAHRWLEYWNAWDTAGRPGRAKPPDFTVLGTSPQTFEADLLGCEEELRSEEHTSELQSQ